MMVLKFYFLLIAIACTDGTKSIQSPISITNPYDLFSKDLVLQHRVAIDQSLLNNDVFPQMVNPSDILSNAISGNVSDDCALSIVQILTDAVANETYAFQSM